jgi:hypothetical protein
MTVTADATGFKDDLREHFGRVLDDATQEMLGDMENDAPRDTGAMTQTITVEDSDSGDVLARTITAPQEYSSFQDTGTGIWIGEGRIYPVNAKALRFTAKDGSVVIVKSVAGTPPTHWWSAKLERWSDYLARALGG